MLLSNRFDPPRQQPTLPPLVPPDTRPVAYPKAISRSWYALGYELWKISRSPVTVQNTISLRGDGESIATGDGYVWVGDVAAGDLVHINPSTDTKTTIHLGKTVGGVTFGAGRVWATVQ